MGERFDWHLEGTLSQSLAIMTLQTKQSQQTAEIGQKEIRELILPLGASQTWKWKLSKDLTKNIMHLHNVFTGILTS